jgi:hypothetical protein
LAIKLAKCAELGNGTTTSTSVVACSTQDLSDEERLVRLNKVFGAWKDQPDLVEKFAEIDRARHADQCRQIDSIDR